MEIQQYHLQKFAWRMETSRPLSLSVRGSSFPAIPSRLGLGRAVHIVLETPREHSDELQIGLAGAAASASPSSLGCRTAAPCSAIEMEACPKVLLADGPPRGISRSAAFCSSRGISDLPPTTCTLTVGVERACALALAPALPCAVCRSTDGACWIGMLGARVAADRGVEQAHCCPRQYQYRRLMPVIKAKPSRPRRSHSRSLRCPTGRRRADLLTMCMCGRSLSV